MKVLSIIITLTSPRKRGGKNAVRSEGLSSFCNGCGDGNIRCNGRGKTSPLRKASGIVRMRNRISTHRRSPYEKDNVIVRTPNHIGTLTLVLRKIIQYNKTHRRDVNSSRRCFCYSLGTIITIPSSCEI